MNEDRAFGGERHKSFESKSDQAQERVLFWPPLWEQRRTKILNAIRDHHDIVNWILDLGCNRCALAAVIANSCLVSRVSAVDVDLESLQEASKILQPQKRDFSGLREWPFRIELFHGSGLCRDPRLQGVHAIICSEVIEHLDPDDLAQLPTALFEHYRPSLVVLSTPNVEFNIYFPGWRPGIMRDADHRFEWTRAEFQSWCLTQAERYGYSAKFTGVGRLSKKPGVEGTEAQQDLGFATQFALFTLFEGPQKKRFWPFANPPLDPRLSGSSEGSESSEGSSWDLCHVIEYPYYEGPDLSRCLEPSAWTDSHQILIGELQEHIYDAIVPYDSHGRNQAADSVGTITVANLWAAQRVRQLFRHVSVLRDFLQSSQAVASGLSWSRSPSSTGDAIKNAGGRESCAERDIDVDMGLASGGHITLHSAVVSKISKLRELNSQHRMPSESVGYSSGEDESW